MVLAAEGAELKLGNLLPRQQRQLIPDLCGVWGVGCGVWGVGCGSGVGFTAQKFV